MFIKTSFIENHSLCYHLWYHKVDVYFKFATNKFTVYTAYHEFNSYTSDIFSKFNIQLQANNSYKTDNSDTKFHPY